MNKFIEHQPAGPNRLDDGGRLASDHLKMSQHFHVALKYEAENDHGWKAGWANNVERKY